MFKKIRKAVKVRIKGHPELVEARGVQLPCFQKGVSRVISESLISGVYEERELSIVDRHPHMMLCWS